MKRIRKILDNLWYPLAAFSLIMSAITDYDQRFMFYTILFTLFGIIADINLDEDN